MDSKENKYYVSLGVGSGFVSKVNSLPIMTLFAPGIQFSYFLYSKTAPRLRWSWMDYVNIVIAIKIFLEIFYIVIYDVSPSVFILSIINALIYIGYWFWHSEVCKTRRNNRYAFKTIDDLLYINQLFLKNPLRPNKTTLIIFLYSYSFYSIIAAIFLTIVLPGRGFYNLGLLLYTLVIVFPTCFFIYIERPKSAWKQKEKVLNLAPNI